MSLTFNINAWAFRCEKGLYAKLSLARGDRVGAVRACLKLSRLEHALEAHAGHEQRGEHGHVPRGLVAHLVVDAHAAVALQATERLLDLPPPRLDDEAPAADRADELPDDAVAGEELAAARGAEAEVHPGEAERGVGGEVRREGGERVPVLHVGRHHPD